MNIVAFLKLPLITDYPLSKPDYFESYKELAAEVEKLGAQFFIVRHQSTYQGNGNFSKSWKYIENQLVDTGAIQADVVYDKGEFKSDGKVKVLNCEKINHICTDKWAMYKLFESFCPKTWLINNYHEFESRLQETANELVVVKPIDGEEGRDVAIFPKDSVPEKLPAYPFLLQEFLDSRGGVPGIVEGLHDFRVALINGEVAYSYFRTPPENSYLANVARGGKFSVVSSDKIPQSFLDIALQIDDLFKDCGKRFYGIDFALTSDGAKIIEMNSRLGLLPNKDGEVFQKLKEKLALSLTQM